MIDGRTSLYEDAREIEEFSEFEDFTLVEIYGLVSEEDDSILSSLREVKDHAHHENEGKPSEYTRYVKDGMEIFQRQEGKRAILMGESEFIDEVLEESDPDEDSIFMPGAGKYRF